MYYFLLLILIVVVMYKFYSYKEGFYYSINPCFEKQTPYIKFDNTYVCFDKKNIIEDTIQIFYGKEKQCYIEPNGTTMMLYDTNGKLTDNVTEKGNKICKPYKVSIN